MTGSPHAEVRPARDNDLTRIAEVERAAGRLFVDVGMPNIAEHPPTPLDVLREHLGDGTLLVATEDVGLVGFATLLELDGHAHLDQMAVHPAYGRRGHGTRLLEAACGLARQRGHSMITLTTFQDVAWNAPYYAERGFRILGETELTDELQDLRTREAEFGLDPSLRVVMRRDLG